MIFHFVYLFCGFWWQLSWQFYRQWDSETQTNKNQIQLNCVQLCLLYRRMIECFVLKMNNFVESSVICVLRNRYLALFTYLLVATSQKIDEVSIPLLVHRHFYQENIRTVNHLRRRLFTICSILVVQKKWFTLSSLRFSNQIVSWLSYAMSTLITQFRPFNITFIASSRLFSIWFILFFVFSLQFLLCRLIPERDREKITE